MRRLSSDTVPRFLSTGASPPVLDARQPGVWKASFRLRSITPILGGGVESFKPDDVDFVRTPSIRGQLRWWWRSLYHAWDESSDSAVADRIFSEEARLWGGVGLPGEGADERESPGCRSRVGLTVGNVSPGEVVPAGVHERGDDGRPKAFPRWDIGRRLGYALFPLQISREDRRGRHGALPTRSCRTQLKFRLDLAVAGTNPEVGPDAAEITQVLASLWAWIFFGGLGARTRRGFGALELTEAPVIEKLVGLDEAVWQSLFKAPADNRLLDWLKDFERVASPRGRAWPIEILTGTMCHSASEAHGEVVDCMRRFRQGRGIGRDEGSSRPGRSHWPEPNLLRTLAPPGEPFLHKPPPDMADLVEAGEVGAPRAAFGLPIQVQFKLEDREDQRANASLLPLEAGRWPSPLLFRPLRSANGKYWPVVVILPFSPPLQVKLRYGRDDRPGEAPIIVPVARHAGSRDPIAHLLSSHQGNALQAFFTWLKGNGYQRISLPKRGGNPHA